MTTNRTLWAEVDEQGRLVLPTHVTARLGVKPGERMRLEEDTSQIRLHQPTGHLAKVYLEPTNRCNITCRTGCRSCIRRHMGRRRPRKRYDLRPTEPFSSSLHR